MFCMMKRILFLMILILGLSSCVPDKTTAPDAAATEAPTTSPTLTPEPSPSPTPIYTGLWGGTWNVWSGAPEASDDIVKLQTVDFSIEGNRLSAEVIVRGEILTVEANISEDGITALGSWQYQDGRSGSATLLISGDRQSFAGNLNGELIFCGSRGGNKRPSPCFTEISGDWNGEWIVWFGPDDTEMLMVMQQDGNQVGVMLYDFSGTVSEDGRTLTGEMNEMGFTGQVEARLLDNQAQFTGYVSGLFPFCGARPGGPMPDPCMGP